MTNDEKRIQYIKIALMIVAFAYFVWRIETIVSIL